MSVKQYVDVSTFFIPILMMIFLISVVKNLKYTFFQPGRKKCHGNHCQRINYTANQSFVISQMSWSSSCSASLILELDISLASESVSTSLRVGYQLNWLTTKNRSNYFTSVLRYELFLSKAPTYLVDRYITNTSKRPIRGYRLSLGIPSFTKRFLENSFYVTSSYFQNSLTPVVRYCTMRYSFKKVLPSDIDGSSIKIKFTKQCDLAILFGRIY